MIARTAAEEKIAGEIFNAGYENQPVKELAEIVKSVVGEDVKLITTPTDDNRSYHISSQKIKDELEANNDFDTDNFEKHHLETYQKRWELEKNIAIKTNNATVYKNSTSNLDTLLEDIKNG